MGRKVIDLIGNKYNKLTVISKSSEKSSNGCPKWICLCDCGNTTVVDRSNLLQGHIKSCGKCYTFNTYDLESHDYGVGYTSNGEEFYFDLEDYDLVKKYNWSKTGSGYLINTKEDTTTSMHRLIMNAPQDKMVDHINHNTLDNRKSNLRICNATQNNINKKTKGYTIRKSGKYEVSLRINDKLKYLGLFDTKEEALKAREDNFDENHKIFHYREEYANEQDNI